MKSLKNCASYIYLRKTKWLYTTPSEMPICAYLTMNNT